MCAYILKTFIYLQVILTRGLLLNSFLVLLFLFALKQLTQFSLMLSVGWPSIFIENP